MTTYETDGKESNESNDLNVRDVRALPEYLTVLEDQGRVRGAADLYLVVSASGSEYLVDTREGTDECPDHEYRGVHCKHARRVEFATGARPIPAGVDGVDPQLGAHTIGVAHVVVTAGGVIKAADGGEGLEETADRRPDDCQCLASFDDLPCWPCYRDGLDEPNPNAVKE